MSIALVEADPNSRSQIKPVQSPLNMPIVEYNSGWKDLNALSQKEIWTARSGSYILSHHWGSIL